MWTGLAQISALYLATVLIGFVCEFGETYLMQRTGQLAMFDLRRELMEHLQRLDVAYYDRNPVGRLITRVTTDVDALNELWASGLVTILGDVLALGFSVFVMLRMSPGDDRPAAGGVAAGGAGDGAFSRYRATELSPNPRVPSRASMLICRSM